MEEWKYISIKGLDYKVSNYGKIIGVNSGRVLKTRLNEDGYVCVTVGSNKEGRTTERVHRLVAKLFVINPNPEEFNEVNHIDFDRTNNHFDNLEWMSHLDNIAYTVKNNRNATAIYNYTGANNPNFRNDTLRKKYLANPELAKINCSRSKEQNGRAQKVKMYDINNNFIGEFNYIGACAEYLINNNLTNAKINSIRNNLSKSAKTKIPYLNHIYEFTY